MQLTFDARRDIKRFLAVGAVSLAFIFAQTAPALAATDSDRDGLTNAQEKITKTSPFKADSDGDKIKDSRENPDRDGLVNIQEFKLGYKPLDRDSDGIDNEDDYTPLAAPTTSTKVKRPG